MKYKNETKNELLISAKREFMEKGYVSASLRNICKNAGVTTGALYFFFEDKEDLFGSIVKEPLEEMYAIMKMHYDTELKNLDNIVDINHDFEDDSKAAEIVLDYLYKYYDEFVLLIMKSQGSKYEKCTDDFVEITEKHYRMLADKMSELYGVEKLDDYTIHWFSHLQIFSFAQYIIHGLSREEAERQLKFLIKFLVNGWMGIFQR